MQSYPKIVLSGGPGGGKTTAADLFRRELGDKVVIVPEAATILYSGGFPRVSDPAIKKITQKTIFDLQKSLEETYARLYPDRYLICDRGIVDGAAYWPACDEDFFSYMGTSLDEEIAGYDGVVFFQTAALGGLSIEGGNACRNENMQEAITIDKKLQNLWSNHPCYTLIPHNKSFIGKINQGLTSIQNILDHLLNT